jgi:hypothetical protein
MLWRRGRKGGEKEEGEERRGRRRGRGRRRRGGWGEENEGRRMRGGGGVEEEEEEEEGTRRRGVWGEVEGRKHIVSTYRRHIAQRYPKPWGHIELVLKDTHCATFSCTPFLFRPGKTNIIISKGRERLEI